MKTNINAGLLLLIFTLSFGIIISSCNKDDGDNNMTDKVYTISGNASGDQETPPVISSATGSLSGTYNAETNTLSYTISWSGLSGDVTVAHFHGPAAPGESASPMIDITGITSAYNNVSKSITLVDSAETHLLNGKLYYNLHTAAHPAGEIRGQVMATPQ